MDKNIDKQTVTTNVDILTDILRFGQIQTHGQIENEKKTQIDTRKDRLNRRA